MQTLSQSIDHNSGKSSDVAANSDDKDGYNSNYQGKTGDEGGNTSSKIKKGIAAGQLALDSHNIALDGASKLSSDIGDAVEVGAKTTGLIGAAIGTGVAGYDIYENGLNWSNGTSFVLGLAAAAILLTPGIGEAAEATSIIIIDAATFGKDIYDMGSGE